MKTIKFSDLPALGADLDGGTFAGVTTKKDGTHCAVILLPNTAQDLAWKKAMNWAEKEGGELPSRPVAALLFANAKDRLAGGWHWTSEEYDASYAWGCDFLYGIQFSVRKSYERRAVAVRYIALEVQ